MKFIKIIATILVASFALTPFAVFAEDGTAEAEAETNVSTSASAPAPMLYQERGEKENRMPPRGTKPPIQIKERMATGTRAFSSTTRPLPARIEQKMEDRDEKSARMMSDCVLPNGETASRTDCMKAREDKREEIREKRIERRGEILRVLANKLIKRLEAAIDREVKLAERIDTRISIFKDRGIDTGEAESQMTIARTKISDAKTAVANAVNLIEIAVSIANLDTAADKVDAGKKVREEMNKAKTAIIDAHKALVGAVRALKAVKISATTTTSVTQ